MNMKKINYPDSPSTDICIPTPEQIVRKDLLQQEKDIHPPPLTKRNNCSCVRTCDTRDSLVMATAICFYALITLLPSCTSSASREKNEAEALAHVTSLMKQADALQCSNTDSAIRLQYRALNILQPFLANDSLRTALWIKLGVSYSIKGELERSDSCYAKAEEVAAIFPKLLVELLIGRGFNQDKRGHTEAAIGLYEQAYTLAAQAVLPDETALRRIDNNRAVSYQHRAQYDSAMICLQRALLVAEKQGESKAAADALMSMGNVRTRMRDDEQADSLFRLADSIYTLTNDVRKRIDIKNDRIITLNRLGLYDKALAISLEAERLADSLGDTKALSVIYNNRGNIYFEWKDYSRALDMTHRSLEQMELTGDTVGIIASLNSSASIHIETKDYAEAIRESMRALQLSDEKHVLIYLQDIYENIATACIRSGDFRAGVEYLEKRNALKDSVFTREKYAVIEEVKTRYETEKQQQRLQIAMLRLKKNRQGIFAMAAFSVLISIAFVYVYTEQRRKLQQYILIARQGERVEELTEQTLAPQCDSDQSERSATGLSEEKSKELLRALRDCMEERMLYKNPSLTLEALAEVVGTNRSYLSILINSRMKKGFTEYVNFYRIREGKRLLKETDCKIITISQEVGYGSPQSFYTAFRNATQLTPAQYRKAIRTANEAEEKAESEK